MDLAQALQLVKAEMAAHGLIDWSFRFDNAKRRFGHCDFKRKTISISRLLTELNDHGRVLDCLRHEIAHALAGRNAGHGRAWQAKAVAIGCAPERCYDSADVIAPAKRWTGTCPSCGKTVQRHRRMRIACLSCCRNHGSGGFHEAYLYRWTEAA